MKTKFSDSWIGGLMSRRDVLQYEIYMQCSLIIDTPDIDENASFLKKRYNKLNHLLQSADPLITWEEMITDFPDIIDRMLAVGYRISQIKVVDGITNEIVAVIETNKLRRRFKLACMNKLGLR